MSPPCLPGGPRLFLWVFGRMCFRAGVARIVARFREET
jgi:hypothetical protein